MKKYPKILNAIISLFRYLPKYRADKSVCTVDFSDADEITVMSYNARCFNFIDAGKTNWYARAPIFLRAIADVKPDVIGFQEIRSPQERYLNEHLSGYTLLHAYNRDGRRKESMTIAYRTGRFEEKAGGFFWLSDTPEKMSKSWKSGSYRIANYVVLTDNRTNKTFTAIDTHLDNVSEEARAKGIKVILEQIEKRGLPRPVLMGDMNDFPQTPFYKEVEKSGLLDAREAAKSVYDGPGPTWHNFGAPIDLDRIDYFFVPPGVDVTEYSVFDKTYDGVYPSDHYPIVIKIKI